MIIEESDLAWLTSFDIAAILKRPVRKIRIALRKGRLGSYQRDSIGQYRVNIHDLELRLGPEIVARHWLLHAEKAEATLKLARTELNRLGIARVSNTGSAPISNRNPSTGLNATSK